MVENDISRQLLNIGHHKGTTHCPANQTYHQTPDYSLRKTEQETATLPFPALCMKDANRKNLTQLTVFLKDVCQLLLIHTYARIGDRHFYIIGSLYGRDIHPSACRRKLSGIVCQRVYHE